MSTSNRRYRLAVESAGSEYVLLAGSWVPAGTGTTAPTGVVGTGFTVTQSASGVFDIAFQRPYKRRISFQCTAMVAGETTDIYAQAGDVTAATSTAGEVIRVRTMTGSTPTNISADGAPRVEFIAVFARS